MAVALSIGQVTRVVLASVVRQSFRGNRVISNRSVLVAFSRYYSGSSVNMLGFHRRTRSLIPVKDLAKYDIVSVVEEEEDRYAEEMEAHDASEVMDKSRQRQMVLIYLIFLAEA